MLRWPPGIRTRPEVDQEVGGTKPTAFAADLNPRTFAMMVAVGASVSYLTPLEPACMMVYGPGRYRFFDFLRVGALLTVAIYLIGILLVPRLWPLAG